MVTVLLLMPWFIINAYTDYKEKKIYNKVNIIFALVSILGILINENFSLNLLISRLILAFSLSGLVLLLAMLLRKPMGGDIKAVFVLFLGLNPKYATFIFLLSHIISMFYFINYKINKTVPLGIGLCISFFISLLIVPIFSQEILGEKINFNDTIFKETINKEYNQQKKLEEIHNKLVDEIDEKVIGKKFNNLILFDENNKEINFNKKEKYIFIISDDGCGSCHDLFSKLNEDNLFKDVKLVQVINNDKFKEFNFEKYFLNANIDKELNDYEFSDFLYNLYRKALPYSLVIENNEITKAFIGDIPIEKFKEFAFE